ncbi:hypothetical protein BT96DRAFT_1008656 [Gymnopus androsaceus JB14]|uniref:Uncharacterized protein n=1 Tax=Gymnopus androsaceus JB14 TaxID=1447944 RepID=A0A6A4GE94_9AGAR|nr:hypothetical protein BT96DRAFT_1008656 [Gymnopus androsaceus JB14]
MDYDFNFIQAAVLSRLSSDRMIVQLKRFLLSISLDCIAMQRIFKNHLIYPSVLFQSFACTVWKMQRPVQVDSSNVLVGCTQPLEIIQCIVTLYEVASRDAWANLIRMTGGSFLPLLYLG